MAATTGEATAVAEDGEYKFATMLEEIPKGTRKLVRLQGANILIFWYRNELYAIENRSPAEGMCPDHSHARAHSCVCPAPGVAEGCPQALAERVRPQGARGVGMWVGLRYQERGSLCASTSRAFW